MVYIFDGWVMADVILHPTGNQQYFSHIRIMRE